MNGVPLSRAPWAARSMPGLTSGCAISSGNKNDMTNVEPGARVAIWRGVRSIASLVRYMLTPVDTTTAGCAASKPAAARPAHQSSLVSKSTGTRRKNGGTPNPRSSRRWRFHAWASG